MNRIECFKEDCETYSELIDGEAVGMYCCPDCNEWQCDAEECACDHVLEENTKQDQDVTTADARIEYHRNGVGGEGYYTIAFDSPDADPPILEIGQRMLAIVPSRACNGEDGWLLPIRGTHIPDLLVINPADAMPFATGDGEMGKWRGADYYSQIVMQILHEERRAEPWNSSEYEEGGRYFGVLPPLPKD